VAVKPPEDVLDAVTAAVAPARSVRLGLRWEQRERYHLTLQFLGPVQKLAPAVDGLAAALRDRDAFEFQLGGAGSFPKPGRARVVWIGPAVGGPDLVGLASAVARGLRPHGYEPDRKEFHPHLTLARLKVPDNVAEVLAAIGSEPVGEPFTVGEVVLYQSQLSSQGPKYTVLERFPLRGA
jgi:RNA 2',3'-cyclic 3'-phosphodiesterase